MCVWGRDNKCLGVWHPLFWFGCISCCSVSQNDTQTALHTVSQSAYLWPRFFFFCIKSFFLNKITEFISYMASTIRVYLPHVHLTVLEVLPMPLCFCVRMRTMSSMCVCMCTRCLDSTLYCVCHDKLNRCTWQLQDAWYFCKGTDGWVCACVSINIFHMYEDFCMSMCEVMGKFSFTDSLWLGWGKPWTVCHRSGGWQDIGQNCVYY